MTNEQLAALLDSYSGRLETILDDIELGLPAGVTRADEWWRGEQKLNAGERFVAAFSWGANQKKLESKGYELRPTGRALVLDGMREFISDLREVVSLLSGDEEAWRAP